MSKADLKLLSNLKEETTPRLHGMPFVAYDPGVVPCLAVEGAFLQRAQLQCETWSQLAQLDALTLLGELVAMVTEENVIALIVEGHCTTATKLGIVVE